MHQPKNDINIFSKLNKLLLPNCIDEIENYSFYECQSNQRYFIRGPYFSKSTAYKPCMYLSSIIIIYIIFFFILYLFLIFII